MNARRTPILVDLVVGVSPDRHLLAGVVEHGVDIVSADGCPSRLTELNRINPVAR
jgi:hypothetical protein